METDNKMYFEIWDKQEAEAEATAEAEFKQMQEQKQEPQAEAETETTETNFYVYQDGIKQNRNMIIIDNYIDTENKKPFKAIGYLSKAEKRILKAIKK